MKKAIFVVLTVVALSLILVTPAAADQGGVSNPNAAWGQYVNYFATEGGLHRGPFDLGQTPFAYGPGGVSGMDHEPYPHEPPP